MQLLITLIQRLLSLSGLLLGSGFQDGQRLRVQRITPKSTRTGSYLLLPASLLATYSPARERCSNFHPSARKLFSTGGLVFLPPVLAYFAVYRDFISPDNCVCPGTFRIRPPDDAKAIPEALDRLPMGFTAGLGRHRHLILLFGVDAVAGNVACA